jgi:hypothetical protein
MVRAAIARSDTPPPSWLCRLEVTGAIVRGGSLQPGQRPAASNQQPTTSDTVNCRLESLEPCVSWCGISLACGVRQPTCDNDAISAFDVIDNDSDLLDKLPQPFTNPAKDRSANKPHADLTIVLSTIKLPTCLLLLLHHPLTFNHHLASNTEQSVLETGCKRAATHPLLGRPSAISYFKQPSGRCYFGRLHRGAWSYTGR